MNKYRPDHVDQLKRHNTRDLPKNAFFFAPGSIDFERPSAGRVGRIVLYVTVAALVVFLLVSPILWALEKSGRINFSFNSLSKDAAMTAPTATPIPAGYWEDARGNLVPESKVKDIDKLRHQVVTDLCRMAEQNSGVLTNFKLHAMQEVGALVATSMEQYGVKSGGSKGNVTLHSYDGKYKLVRQMQDRITFGEQLVAAKELIDQCVHQWTEGGNENARALINHAFQTDKDGHINVGRVLSLRTLDIKDPMWLEAMQAIADSMQTHSTKPYVRFYKRHDTTGEYLPINLDVAAV